MLRICQKSLFRTGSNIVNLSKQSRRSYPVCTVETNLRSEEIPVNLSRDLCKVLAETLEKPEQLVSVTVSCNQLMCRGGSTNPTLTMHLWSIGVFDEKRNPKYAKDVISFIQKSLNIPADRIAMLMHPISKEQAGHLIYKS